MNDPSPSRAGLSHMSVLDHQPFVLSLSKDIPSSCPIEREGFDKLSPNGWDHQIWPYAIALPSENGASLDILNFLNLSRWTPPFPPR
jgi:hypothetical protein